MNKKKYFIAGTDTDVGKTFVSVALLNAVKEQGLTCLGLKPVAAGCDLTDEGLQNDDAIKLMHASTVKLRYSEVNPIALRQAIAPHVAAKNEGKVLECDEIIRLCDVGLNIDSDVVLVEGAGGWRVPLNEIETLAALPVKLKLPVILVVGVKLGCISHAMLTVEAIENDGLELVGWIANHVDPDMECSHDTVDYLQNHISAPMIGRIPFITNPNTTSTSYLQISKIL